MQAVRRFSGLICTAALLFGCGPDEMAIGPSAVESINSTGQRISGGYEDVDDTSVVGIYDDSAHTICTGSLIAPNVVLTARHCVSDVLNTVQGGVVCSETTFSGPHEAAAFTVFTAPVIATGAAGSFAVAEVVLLPVQSDSFCGNDLAILILASNVPASLTEPLVPGVTAELSVGDEYSAVGYGATDDAGNGAGTRRRRDDLSVDCVASGCPLIDVVLTSTEWTGDQGICSGDSGGPALDTQSRVIGVTSRGASNCDDPIYGYVYAWGQWLKDTVVYASGMGLYEAPSWTEGATTEPEYSMPIGQSCQLDGDCPAGHCLTEDSKSYCTRPCKQDAPCPTDYYCDTGLSLCRLQQVQPALPHTFVRADRGKGCQLGAAAPGSLPSLPSLAYWLGAGLALAGRRLRRLGSPNRRHDSPTKTATP